MNTDNHPLFADYNSQLERANELIEENNTDQHAINAYEQCVEIARKIGDTRLLSHPLYQLGVAHLDLYFDNDQKKDLLTAKKYFDEALQIAEQYNLNDDKAILLVHLGRIAYFLNNDWKCLYRNSVEAASIAKQINNKEILSIAEELIAGVRKEHPREYQKLERETNDEYSISEIFQEATLVVSGSGNKPRAFHDILITGKLSDMGIFDANFRKPEKYSPIPGMGEGKSISIYKYQVKYSGEMPMDKLSKLSSLFPELIIEFDAEEKDGIAIGSTWANGEMVKSGYTYEPSDEGPASVKTADSGNDAEADFLSSINKKDESVEIKLNETLDYVAGLLNQDNPKKAKIILEEVINEYHAAGNQRDLNLARTMLASAHRLILEEDYPDYDRDPDTDQEFQVVMNGLEKAEKYFKQKDDAGLLLNVYTEQAGLLIATNQLDQAQEILTNNNDIALRTARFHNLQFGFGQLGEILEKQNKPEEALTAYKRQVLVAKKHNNADGLARALYNIGWLYKRQNDPKNARKYFSEALPICKAEGLFAMQFSIEDLIKEIDGSSNKEPQKFLNADREPGQKPPTGGGCFTLLVTFFVFVVMMLILF